MAKQRCALSIGLTLASALLATLSVSEASGQECVATAIRDSHSVFRDEGTIWDKCNEYEGDADCTIEVGEHLLVTAMALLPRYTTETFFFLRRHERFTCYPAEDFELSADCLTDSLPMINGAACE